MIDEMRISDLEIDVSTGIMKNNDVFLLWGLTTTWEKKVVISNYGAGLTTTLMKKSSNKN